MLISDEKKWEDEFNGKLFFPHKKTSSCKVLIGTKKLKVIKKNLATLDKFCDESFFVLINIYNTEPDQLKTFTNLSKTFDCVGDIQNKDVIFSGDFNVIFDSLLDVQGGKPSLSKYTLTKIIQIKEKLNLDDIWKIRNPKTKRLTFRNIYNRIYSKEIKLFFHPQSTTRDYQKSGHFSCLYLRSFSINFYFKETPEAFDNFKNT